MAGVMPNLHVYLENVRGSGHFGLFDFIKVYWQLRLAKKCQGLHRKIYTLKQVPQGCSDVSLFFSRQWNDALRN